LRYIMAMDRPAVIEVVDYDPAWAERFATERDVLLPTLRVWLAGEIEHVGSTAVAGLCAKPVIDILVPVHDLAASRPAIDPLERRHGYLYSPYRSDEMHWLCKPTPELRTHHVHMIPVTSRLYRERLAFRDALRADSALCRRYGDLKRQLARQHGHDREAYTEAKAPFIANVLRSIA
jgi:GrpB-like predicted nucleotidyltransferase (UPF0157 family)